MKFISSYKSNKKEPKRARRMRRGLGWWYEKVCESTMLRMALCGMILMFGVGYSVLTSSTATKGYELSDVEQQVYDLREENQRLRLSIAEHRSLQNIQSKINTLGLVPVEKINYVSTLGPSVAQR